tara:strand:- start:2980 stop:3336 length:357 start_codon:yes stop_codon:yes gene_type:complete
MGINSTEVSYNFGQLGSAFIDQLTTTVGPPTNKVFVAITVIRDTTFDSLIADNDATGAGLEYIGTTTAAHDAVTATVLTGRGGEAIDGSNIFPAGITIYGRWTEINLGSGECIAYIGD